MAEHTKLHLWINTLIAAMALFASAASAFVSWQTYKAKSESIGFSPSSLDPSCKLEIHKSLVGSVNAVDLCWLVTLSNQSDATISLVDSSVDSDQEVAFGNMTFNTHNFVQDTHDSPVSLPIVLEAGTARTYMFRIPLLMPGDVSALADAFAKSNAGSPATYDNFETYLLMHLTDYSGNNLIIYSALFQFLTGSTAEVRFTSGRGNVFTTTLRSNRLRSFYEHLHFLLKSRMPQAPAAPPAPH